MSSPQGKPTDLEALARQIRRLRLERERKQDKECEDCKALINLAFAEREAKGGSEQKAVEHLKRAGKGSVDLARRISALTYALTTPTGL